MISSPMTKALCHQINAEMYSAYLYLSMSSYASYHGLKGAANWYRIQAQEEMTHAEMFYNYVNRQGERVTLDAIAKPPANFKSLLDTFEETLKHEKKVTALIHALADLAIEEKDHATGIFLQWFVTEQVEEEENAKELVDRMKLAGDHGSALFMLDKDLGTRVFTPPAPAAE